MSAEFKRCFEAFYLEIGEPPFGDEDYTVERVDNSKNYEAGNILWATRADQARNRRMFSNNSSGITGVNYSKKGNNEYWVACWYDKSGYQKRKLFSITLLGTDIAKQMANDYRLQEIEKLKSQGVSYSDSHGK